MAHKTLSNYEHWMVCSNLRDVEAGEPSATVVAKLKVNGFPQIAEGVAKARLKHLRREIDAERISYGEIAELQSLTEYIDAGDVQLLEWAGVPEEASN